MPELDLELEALKLAESGMRVFPLDGEKRPRTPNGFNDATSNAQDILKWDWHSASAIGAAIPEGTFVVDIDPRNSGDSTADTLRQAGLYMPSTRVHRTRGGGTHRFYKLPPGSEDCRLRGKLGPGIDVKAPNKGYVVVPPSPGYSVAFDRDPVVAPEWMLAELVKEQSNGNGNGLPASQKYFDMFQDGTEYGMAALEKEIGRLLLTGEGDRNNALNKAAFSLAQLAAGGELSADTTIEKLHLAGERMGLPQDEVAATVLSGWESGSEIPRTAPEKNFRDSGFTPPTTQPSEEEHFWLDWQNASSDPPPFFVWPIIPRNAYVTIYGPTEASKSIVLNALAAAGSHLGVRSSIYSLENGAHIDADRAKRLAPNPNCYRITNAFLDINDERQVEDLLKRESCWPDGGSTDILGIDTYSHAYNSVSEDGNAKAIHFAKIVRYIMSEIGCSIVVLDHTGYSSHGGPRDASAKLQQCDTACYMEKVGEWTPGQPSRWSMENKKSARFANPYFLRGRVVDKPNRGLAVEFDPGYEIEWRI